MSKTREIAIAALERATSEVMNRNIPELADPDAPAIWDMTQAELVAMCRKILGIGMIPVISMPVSAVSYLFWMVESEENSTVKATLEVKDRLHAAMSQDEQKKLQQMDALFPETVPLPFSLYLSALMLNDSRQRRMAGAEPSPA